MDDKPESNHIDVRGMFELVSFGSQVNFEYAVSESRVSPDPVFAQSYQNTPAMAITV